MIRPDPSVEIINKDHRICTLSKNMNFRMDLRVEKGRGFVTAEENTPEGDQEVGYIPVDSLFSPVIRVRYRTEDTRVGHRTNYDRLIMELWTNGTVTPDMALVEAAKILRKHLNPFVEYFTPGEEVGAEVAAAAEEVPAAEEYVSELERKLAMPIAQLELSVRASNCLESENIMTVGQLVRLVRGRPPGDPVLRQDEPPRGQTQTGRPRPLARHGPRGRDGGRRRKRLNEFNASAAGLRPAALRVSGEL